MKSQNMNIPIPTISAKRQARKIANIITAGDEKSILLLPRLVWRYVTASNMASPVFDENTGKKICRVPLKW